MTGEDNDFAVACDGCLKLVATAIKCDDGLSLSVAPCVVMNDNPLSSAKGVFNAVKVDAGDLGDILLYGMGAGKYPTASAVISDIMAVLLRERTDRYTFFAANDQALLDLPDLPDAYCLAVEGDIGTLHQRIPSMTWLSCQGNIQYILCEDMSENAIRAALEGITIIKCMRAIV